MKLTNLRRAIGAAHIGYSMFGARGPLLAPEGDGAGAGSGGGESTATTATTAASATTGDPATAPGATASEKMLPQSQVNTLIANAKREAREATRRELEQQQQQAAPKKEEPKPSGNASSLSATDVQQIVARERAIERASVGLTPGRAARMEEACRAANPSDVAAWCKSYREDMGFDMTQPAQPVAPATPAAQAAPAAPAQPAPAAAPAASGGPVNPVTTGGIIDLFQLSHAQLQQLGPAGVRAELDKIRNLHHQQSGLARLPRVPERK